MYAASSREALGVARTKLESELRSASDSVAVTTGDELLATAAAVAGDRALQAALGDSAVAPANRVEVARAVLTGKVSAPTLGAVETVAGENWSRPEDLASGLRDLGIDALLLAAQQSNSLDTVQDELFRLGRIVAGSPQLDLALADRSRPVSDRAALLRGLIEGKAHPVTVRLADTAFTSGESDSADAILALSERAAAAEGKKVAYVQSAKDLTDQQRTQLAEQIARIAGGPVTLHADVDPSLLGGVVVRIGDERIDGSVAGRLAAARRSFR